MIIQNKKIIYIIPLALGLLARIIAYLEWFASPFHYYHTITGLDMRKFLVSGTQFAMGNESFTPYNFFIAMIYKLVGSEILAETVIMGQIVLGLGTIFLTIYIAFRLFGNRFIALISGLSIALYGPMIVYETQILKATIYLFISTLSLALFLYARKRKFSNISIFLSGALILMPLMIRFAGILWLTLGSCWLFVYLMKKILTTRKVQKLQSLTVHQKDKHNEIEYNLNPLVGLKPYKIALIYCFGIIIAFTAVLLINSHNKMKSGHYFKANFNYIISTGVSKDGDISTYSKTTPNKNRNKGITILSIYLSKLKYIFSASEMPNNINYYFIKKKIFLYNYLITPIFLIPLAVSGLILMIFRGGLYKKESILFIYLVAFTLPAIIFLPLSRYKITLIPIFALSTGYFIYNLLVLIKNIYSIYNKKKNDINGNKEPRRILERCNHHELKEASLLATKPTCGIWILPLYSIILLFSILNLTSEERSSDDKAYGVGACYIPDKLMLKGQFKEAKEILAGYYKNNPNNQMIALNYASALLGLECAKEAENVLLSLKTPLGLYVSSRYYFDLGEAFRMQRKNREALECYKLSKQYPMSKSRKRLLNRLDLKIRGKN